MAEEIERLIVRLEGNVDQFERAMARAAKAAGGASGKVKKELERIKKDLDRTGREAGQSFVPMQRSAQLAFAALTAYSVKAAADAGEIQNAFEVAFGASAKEAKAFAQGLGDEVGRSVTELQSGMSRMQLVLTGMGVSAEQALKMTQALTQRGVDIGSLWNVSDAQALQAIISGLSGETEPLKKFGAVLSEAQVKAELLRLGFKGNAEAASEQAKAVARANLILAKTTSAHGDAAKTADSTANQFKRATAEFHDAAVKLGNELLPAVTNVTSSAADLAKEFGNLPTSVQLGGLALLGLVAASGPIASVIGGMAKLIKYAQAARAALAGVAGASAGAGAAGAAGAVGGAAGLAMGTGIGSIAVGMGAIGISGARAGQYRNTAAAPGKASDDALASAIAYANANIAALAGDKANTIGRGAERMAQFRAELAAFANEQQRRTAAADQETKTAADAAAAAAIQGFGLTEDQLKATGGGKGRKGAVYNGPSPADLDRQAALALAQAAGNEKLERSLGDQIEAQRRIKDYQEAGLSLAAATARVTDQMQALQTARGLAEYTEKFQAKFADFVPAAQMLERVNRVGEDLIEQRAYWADQELATQIELAQLLGDPKAVQALERQVELRRRAAEYTAYGLTPDQARDRADKELTNVDQARLKGQVRDAFAGGIEAAVYGGGKGLMHYLADSFKQRLIDGLANTLTNLVMGNGRPGGGGGMLGKILGFAGFFAEGGSIPAGKFGIAGERGPEPVFGPATVLPNRALQQMAAPAGGSARPVQFVTIDARGAMIWEDEAAKLRGYADQVAGVAGMGSYRAAARDIPQRVGIRSGQRLGR